MTKLTILETGEVPRQFRDRFGSLPDMFEAMISRHREGVEFEVFKLLDGYDLPDVHDVQALLVTGSSFGVYDDIPWKAPVESLIRAVHARNIPMVGVCFGHQIIAQALGGTVRKADRGWGLGRHVYDVHPGNGLIDAPQLAIACSHQDQVLTPPPDATTILSSAFTPHAGLLYANGSTFTVQPHPEFVRDYAYALCEMREGLVEDAVVRRGKESLDLPMDNDVLGAAIARLLTDHGRRSPS